MNPKINDQVALIGCPMDMGASLRGGRLGPEAIRLAGLQERLEKIGYHVTDHGDVEVHNDYGHKRDQGNLNHLAMVKEANENLYKKVDQVLEERAFPLILGGDHSIAMGSIKAVLNHYPDLGVLWFDAHGDINTTETTPSGNIHGMPVATLMGQGSSHLLEIGQKDHLLKRENLVYIGSRDLDLGERQMMRDFGVKVFTMHEVDALGVQRVIKEALDYLGDKTKHIHVSFDMDVLDPEVAPGTGTKVPGGMAYREGHLCLESVAQTGQLVSCEFVEVNPILDHENKTAQAAVALAGSLLGEWLI